MQMKGIRLETIATSAERGFSSFPDIAPVLHQTSTFRAIDDAAFAEMATTPRHSGYYTRDGNPTVAQVEEFDRLA